MLSSHEDGELATQVCRDFQSTTAVVEELECLLQDHLLKDVPSAELDRVSDVGFSKRAWLEHETKALDLLKQIRECRFEIDKNLTLLFM